MVAKFLRRIWMMVPIKGKVITIVICSFIVIVWFKQIPSYDTIGFRLFMVLTGVLMIAVAVPIMITLIGHKDRRRGPQGASELGREDEQEPKGSYIPQNVVRPVSRRWHKKGGDDA